MLSSISKSYNFFGPLLMSFASWKDLVLKMKFDLFVGFVSVWYQLTHNFDMSSIT